MDLISDMNDTIDETKCTEKHSFTFGWLLSSLKERDNLFNQKYGKRKVKNISTKCISTGNGFLSVVLQCKIEFEDSHASDDSSEDIYFTLIKIPGIQALLEARKNSDAKNEDFSEDFIKRLIEFHKCECYFYQNLAPILEIPVPKVYSMKEWILNEEEGCLLMEDLSFKSKCLGYFESANLSQIRNIIEHLAHLHKNCLEMDSEKWKGKFLKNQTWLADTIKGMETEIEPFLKKCGRERDFIYLLNKLKPFFLNPSFYNYVTKQHIHDLNIQPVLIHADLYPGNILWNTDKNGEIQNSVAAFIDWQLWCEGSPMADIARFLCQCCDGNTRRKAETFATDYYLKCLMDEFKGKPLPYTCEQLKRSYQLCFLSQAFQTLGMTTFMSANSQIKDSRILKANFDFGVLKALHAWEDCLWILEGDLKDIYEKFG